MSNELKSTIFEYKCMGCSETYVSTILEPFVDWGSGCVWLTGKTIADTKVMIVVDNGLGAMLHDSRTDWSMLLGSIILIIKGGGKWSLDKK